MSRSPYAVTSALVVACPGCRAPIGKRCVAKAGYEMQHCHPARRRLADEQRTRKVNSKLLPPLEHDYLPTHEPLSPRVPDLCPDDMGFARVDIIKQEQRRVYESAHGPACGCDDCKEERNR